MASSAHLAALRQLVSTRFPQAARPRAGAVTTDIPGVDTLGGLPRAALTELVCLAPSSGSQLFLGQVLQATRRRHERVALIDGADGFDPASWPEDACRHVLWVRCRTLAEALAAADVCARDANWALVALDLRHAAPRALRRLPATTWYRLQRAVRSTDLAFLALTPQPLIPSAQLRLQLERPHPLAAQEESRAHLLSKLNVALQRQRGSSRLAAG